MKPPKLPAFTIIELVVALLLMTIVVAVAYAALALTSKQLGGLQQRFGIDNEHRLLQHALQQDFEAADRITQQEGHLIFRSPVNTIHYELLDSAIVRHGPDETRDSFHFALDSAFVGFESREQIEENGLIDELRLQLKSNKNSYPIYVHKVYDAVNLMK
ncbi:hypothetical protein RYH73_06385 [Olivibacter sp. CPCC 100613]|uniref:hypothetical protein n=1 Tax=Olivibacter sp. CPCC 100613 TaxID=3079931 RepID=UPI002FF748F3